MVCCVHLNVWRESPTSRSREITGRWCYAVIKEKSTTIVYARKAIDIASRVSYLSIFFTVKFNRPWLKTV